MDYFERKLDDKRRLTIPTELRNEFASGVVVTRGFRNYLHLYPKQVWDREVEPKLAGSILDEAIADLNVRFRRGKTEAALDQKQGRLSIEPTRVRRHRNEPGSSTSRRLLETHESSD